MLATATSMGAGVIVCGLIGYYIDSKFENEQQYWTLGGIGIGLAYLAYEVWKVVRVVERNEKQRDD